MVRSAAFTNSVSSIPPRPVDGSMGRDFTNLEQLRCVDPLVPLGLPTHVVNEVLPGIAKLRVCLQDSHNLVGLSGIRERGADV